jgi:hypothetical protein
MILNEQVKDSDIRTIHSDMKNRPCLVCSVSSNCITCQQCFIYANNLTNYAVCTPVQYLTFVTLKVYAVKHLHLTVYHIPSHGQFQSTVRVASQIFGKLDCLKMLGYMVLYALMHNGCVLPLVAEAINSAPHSSLTAFFHT